MTTPLGGPYATRDQLKRRQGIPDTNTYVDSDLDDALSAASVQVNRYCGRQFGQAASATDRTFEIGKTGIQTDDFFTTTGLVIDGTAWASITAYDLYPSDGVLDGVPGWPYLRLRNRRQANGWAWPWILANQGGRIVVTAQWGWAAVPADIVSATLMLAAEELKLKDTPFGVAGFGDFAIRVRSNPKIAERLDPYRVRVGLVG